MSLNRGVTKSGVTKSGSDYTRIIINGYSKRGKLLYIEGRLQQGGFESMEWRGNGLEHHASRPILNRGFNFHPPVQTYLKEGRAAPKHGQFVCLGMKECASTTQLTIPTFTTVLARRA